jgi:hypothetical protein
MWSLWPERKVMDDIQRQHERAVGDIFIAEFNCKQKTAYVFERRGNPVPDLIYRDINKQIGLEILTCYYDVNHAKFVWKHARCLPNAPKDYFGVDFNQALIKNINERLQEKCKKDYGPNCYLVIYLSFPLTTYKEIVSLLPNVKLPFNHNFVGFYVVGYFGVNNDSKENHAIMEITID